MQKSYGSEGYKVIPLVKTNISDKAEMMPAIEKILYSGYIAEGKAVYDFEDELKQYIGNNNLLALNSGTAALPGCLRKSFRPPVPADPPQE